MTSSVGPAFGRQEYGDGSVYGGAIQTLQFFDETGINPLPAGIKVIVNDLTAGTVVGTAWTQPLGLCSISVPDGHNCEAVFSLSAQAPGATTLFTPDGVTQPLPVTVAPYRSPSLSATGYAVLQCLKLVRGWYGDAAKRPGGIAYAITAGGGAGLQLTDAQTQQVLSTLRLQSSIGPDVDSWSMDMVGPMFRRYPQESDNLFIARNEIMVSRPRCTINAIQAFVQAFYASVLAGWQVTGNEALAYDTAGGINVSGGLNTAPSPTVPGQPPTVVVWDPMTEPQLATSFGIHPPQFVIQIGNLTASLKQLLAFNETGGFDISGAFNVAPSQSVLPTPTATAPDPRLGAMINLLAKAGGTVPMYLIGQL